MQEESQNYQNKDRLIRSFGRIKSRKLSDQKHHLLNDKLPNYEIKNFVSEAEKNYLEIGFGFGDFLFEHAKNNPKTFHFACEPHINGVVYLLAKLEKDPLENLKISREDVRILLQNFPDKFFDEIYILFPDPWPKSKHFKRRLIDKKFLDEILSPKMKNNGSLVIATDHDSYKTWILSEILRSKKFFWNAQSKKDWKIFPTDWTETKYQKKAYAEGRVPVIFNLTHNA